MEPTREFENQEEIDATVAEGVAEVLNAPTGAACFKTFGLASCSEGLTHAQAKAIAKKYGMSLTWYQGKTCQQITCKA